MDYGEGGENPYLSGDYGGGATMSDETAELVDAEVRKIVSQCLEDTRRILRENRDKVEHLVAALLAVVVTVILLVWLLRLDKGEWLKGLSLGLLIGGAIGNLADRIRLGYVVDFIDWHYGGWHWPAFNIADAAITCGIILLLLDAFFEAKREKQAKAAEEH